MIRVLLIEDNELDQELVEHVLSKQQTAVNVQDSVRVRCVRSLTKALQVPLDDVDIVLMDLGLPDGEEPSEMIRRIKKRFSDRPIYVVSGNTDIEAAKVVGRAEAEFINKDTLKYALSVQTLAAAVEKARACRDSRWKHEEADRMLVEGMQEIRKDWENRKGSAQSFSQQRVTNGRV